MGRERVRPCGGLTLPVFRLEEASQFIAEDRVGAGGAALDPADVECCSCTCQVSQLLDRGWRHKARPDQAMRQKVGDPHCVVDVTLAAGNIADMSSIREHKLEPTLQHVPDRLLVDARSLHRHVRDSWPASQSASCRRSCVAVEKRRTSWFAFVLAVSRVHATTVSL